MKRILISILIAIVAVIAVFGWHRTALSHMRENAEQAARDAFVVHQVYIEERLNELEPSTINAQQQEMIERMEEIAAEFDRADGPEEVVALLAAFQRAIEGFGHFAGSNTISETEREIAILATEDSPLRNRILEYNAAAKEWNESLQSLFSATMVEVFSWQYGSLPFLSTDGSLEDSIIIQL